MTEIKTVTIDQLPEVEELTGDEVFPIVQDGKTLRARVSLLTPDQNAFGVVRVGEQTITASVTSDILDVLGAGGVDVKIEDNTLVIDGSGIVIEPISHSSLLNLDHDDHLQYLNVTRADEWLSGKTSDDLAEGTTNLYMTAAERTKLGGIQEGAEANQNAYSTVSAGGSSVSASSESDTIVFAGAGGINVSIVEAMVTIDGSSLPIITVHGDLQGLDADDHLQYLTAGRADTWLATKTSDDITQGTNNLYMSAAEKTKLSGVEDGAEVNQNAFSSIRIGEDILNAASKTDEFEIAGTGGITVSLAGSVITLDGDGVGGVTVHANLLGLDSDDHLQYLTETRANTWLSGKTSDDIAAGTANLYMTPAEKTKLSGVEDGAEVNQNAFSSITIGDSTIQAQTESDDFSIQGTGGIDITVTGSTINIDGTPIRQNIDHGSLSGLSEDDHHQYLTTGRADEWLSGKTSDDITAGTINLYMTAAERTKLSGIQEGAEANQNAFSSIIVGENTLTAASETASFEITVSGGLVATIAGTAVNIDASGISSGGITVHGELQGLDADDHHQYLTAGRADLWFSNKTTDDLAIGTENLFMSPGEKTKLGGISPGAEVNQNAFSSITVDAATLTADSKSDNFILSGAGGISITLSGSTITVDGSGISGGTNDHSALLNLDHDDHLQYLNVTRANAWLGDKSSDDIAEGSSHLFMTSAERTKLQGIQAGAEVNQNAFSSITVGETSITADSETATFAVAGAGGIVITTSGSTITVDGSGISSGGITVHGQLQGLDADDHLQYLNEDRANTWLSGKNSDAINEGSTHLFMTSAERTKLQGVQAGAEANQNAFATVTVGESSVVASSKSASFELAGTGGIALSVTDNIISIDASGIAWNGVTDHGLLTGLGDDDHLQYLTEARANVWLDTKTSDNIAQGSSNLYMTSSEKSKLQGIAAGAEVNQNAFSKVAVDGQPTITADNTTDTLTIVAGTGITLQTSANTLTISTDSSVTGVSLGMLIALS